MMIDDVFKFQNINTDITACTVEYLKEPLNSTSKHYLQQNCHDDTCKQLSKYSVLRNW